MRYKILVVNDQAKLCEEFQADSLVIALRCGALMSIPGSVYYLFDSTRDEEFTLLVKRQDYCVLPQ